MMVPVLIAAGVLIAAVLAAVALLYNRLVRLRNKVDNAWKRIDVELTRRHDLIPRLESVVKGYAAHEKETLAAVAAARAAALEAAGVAGKAAAEERLTSAAAGLLALGEAYPGLKADQEFARLSAALTETEDRIAGARKYYNGSVMQYENARDQFPGNLVALAFSGSFTGRDYFQMEAGAGSAPAV